MWSIYIQIQPGSNELWPRNGFWLCFHCDLDIVYIILGQGHDTPLDHGQQLCKILSRFNSAEILHWPVFMQFFICHVYKSYKSSSTFVAHSFPILSYISITLSCAFMIYRIKVFHRDHINKSWPNIIEMGNLLPQNQLRSKLCQLSLIPCVTSQKQICSHLYELSYILCLCVLCSLNYWNKASYINYIKIPCFALLKQV